MHADPLGPDQLTHHADNEHTDHQHTQQHQHQRCLPLGAEEQVQRDGLLVVQREGEKGKKNGCVEQPHQVFQIVPFVVGRL